GTDDPLLGYQAWTTGHVHVYCVTDGQGRQLAVATKAGLDATSVGTYMSYGGTCSGGATGAFTFGVARLVPSAEPWLQPRIKERAGPGP
ncbi:MAG: hypothetical protein ABJC74_14280, partial [Gemmatimonadota bacterium]